MASKESTLFTGETTESTQPLVEYIISHDGSISDALPDVAANNSTKAKAATFFLLYRVLDIGCMVKGYAGLSVGSCVRLPFPHLNTITVCFLHR